MIDKTRLDELKQEIGEEDFAEVAEIFLEEMAEAIEALCARPDQASAADFHGLRGSASNLGFAAFAEACSKAEQDLAVGGGVDMQAINGLYQASLEAAAGDLPLPV